MGRGGSGVTPRETSIQVAFTYGGKPLRLTLKSGGQKLLPTPANLKFAARLVAEIKQKIQLGVFVFAEYFPDEAGQDTSNLSAYLTGWEKTLRAPASTKAKYKSACNFWRAGLGTKTPSNLKPSDIRTAIAESDLAGKSVNDYVSVLRLALQGAVDDKLIGDNPVSKIEAVQAQSPPPDPFTPAETEAIIAKLRERSAEDADYAEARFFTGLRTGEAIGLRWTTLELKQKRMTIVGGRVRGEDRDATKTGKARVVDLNSRSMAALTRQQKRTGLAGKHVFLNPRTGLPYDNESEFTKQVWIPVLKLLQIRYRRPYNMRHTYATMMLMAGMTPAYCAGQLGHSVEVFHRTYAKWINGDRNALEQSKLESFMAGAIPGAIDEDSKGSDRTLS